MLGIPTDYKDIFQMLDMLYDFEKCEIITPEITHYV